MYNPIAFPFAEPSFNPAVDRSPVDQSGMIDLRNAYVHGVVEGDVAISDSSFNGIQDPADIMYRAKDNFEAMRNAQYVRESLRAAKSQTEQVTQMGESK